MENIISKEIISKFLPKNPIIIEAGAHKGKTTLELATYLPDAFIHAFEPSPAIYEDLVKNCKSFTNIFTYNLALSNQSKKTHLYDCLGKYSQLSSLHMPSEYFTKNPKFTFKEIEILSTTLNEWAIANKLHKIDMLWLDAQGAELSILNGAGDHLNKIKLILLEANTSERYKDIALYPEIKQWLREKNFIEIMQSNIRNNRMNVLFRLETNPILNQPQEERFLI